jgi:hypothetical protein
VSEAAAPVAETEPDEETEPQELPAEQPDEEEQPAEQPAAEPEQPAAVLSERELEAALERLAKEATRHASRVSEIMGEDAQALEPCPLCEPHIPGFLWPGAIEEEKRVASLELLGIGGEAGLVEDPATATCDYCKGHGETITGSSVATQRTRPCPVCAAKGWTTPEERNTWNSTQAARDVAAELQGNTPGMAPAASTLPQTDAWGRPVGHQFYGMNPTYMTAEQRASDVPGAS